MSLHTVAHEMCQQLDFIVIIAGRLILSGGEFLPVYENDKITAHP